MDLGKAITWADINLNSVTLAPTGQPMSGYKVEKIVVSPPPLTQYVEKRALNEGLVASDVYLGGRNIMAIVTAYGTSAGDFWDKTQALARVMSAPLRRLAAVDDDEENTEGFGYLSFYQPTMSTGVGQWPTSAYPNGIPLAYEVRPLQMSYELERQHDDSDGPMSKSFDMNWIARDPRKIHTTYASAVSVSGASTSLAYRGDYPNYPIVQWTQTAAGGGTMSLLVDGISIGVSISEITSGLPANMNLDFNTRTLFQGDPLDSASTIRTEILSTIGGFPQVRNGSTFDTASVTGVANGTVTLKVLEAFA
jgi:hypothetical protein